MADDTVPHYWFPVPPSGDRPIKWWFPFVDDSGHRVWDFPVRLNVGGLPAPPAGFAYILNKDGSYLTNKDGAYILAKV